MAAVAPEPSEFREDGDAVFAGVAQKPGVYVGDVGGKMLCDISVNARLVLEAEYVAPRKVSLPAVG